MKAKKIIIGIISAVLIAGITFFTICLVNCIVYRNTEKPWDINNVIWYSANPKIEIFSNSYTGYIVINEEKIDILFAWSPSYYLYIYDINSEQTTADNLLLNGKFIYDGTNITLSVLKDNVFNYQYKTITLYRRAIEE